MSFYTALSGLNAAQRDIAATSNNIANVGTVGFHRSRAEFADIFANPPYNRPTSQVGDGVETARMTRGFSQGTTRATGNVLDLSLRGPGFFQVRTGGEGSDDGVISATYGGEVSMTVGRVSVANFADPQALTPVGNSTYLSTMESGAPRLAAPGEAGYGQLRSGVLEQSNVELTEELVHLITAQRNYQASAKALETSSSLAQTIIQMRG